MLYTKKIEEISYTDVIDFCNEQIPENLSLDYKLEIDANLVKTISAMANTWGGIIILGVEDNDSKPLLPVRGIPYKEHTREQINNLILGNITPPILPEVQICQSDDGEMMLGVIKIPQSNTAPHAIKNNTKVYIRTNTSNEPESLITLDKMLWLTEKRERAKELKESFYEMAASRLYELVRREKIKTPKIILSKNWTPIPQGDLTLAACPSFPYEILLDYRNFNSILQKALVNEYHGSFPTNLNRKNLESIHNGVYSIIQNDDYICYEEFNQYGFVYHREYVGREDKGENEEFVVKIYLISLLIRVNCFLKSISKLYDEIGYWGYIDITFSLSNLYRTSIIDFPAPRGKYKIDNIIKNPLDDYVFLKRNLKVADIKNNYNEVTVDLMLELSWALGFNFIQQSYIQELIDTGW